MKKMIIARTLNASNPEISGFLGVTSVDPTNHLVGLSDCVPRRWDCAVTPRPCGPETKLQQEYALTQFPGRHKQVTSPEDNDAVNRSRIADGEG